MATTTTSAEFEKATDYQFKEEDIERAKALVGRWAPSAAREHLTTATPDAMRNFARGYGDDNPLFTSEDYGTATRWGGQIAPPMIPIALEPPAVRRPARGDGSSARRSVASTCSCPAAPGSWYRPLLEGDQLYSFGGTESVVEKKSEFAERSVLVTYASVKMNQRAEIVAISRTLAIHTERKTAREKGKYSALEPATYTDEDIEQLDAIYAAEQVQGAEPRWWEDVHVGDVLQPDGQGSAHDDRHDRLPRRRLRVRALRAVRQPDRLQEPPAHRAVLRQERVRRARRRAAGPLGLGLGPGHRQPDGLRLRGDARLLADRTT